MSKKENNIKEVKEQEVNVPVQQEETTPAVKTVRLNPFQYVAKKASELKTSTFEHIGKHRGKYGFAAGIATTVAGAVVIDKLTSKNDILEGQVIEPDSELSEEVVIEEVVEESTEVEA